MNRKLEGTSKVIEHISSKKGQKFNITPTQFQHSEITLEAQKMAGDSKDIPSFFQFPELATHLF